MTRNAGSPGPGLVPAVASGCWDRHVRRPSEHFAVIRIVTNPPGRGAGILACRRLSGRQECLPHGGPQIHSLLIVAVERPGANATEDGNLVARFIDGAVAVESFGYEERRAPTRHASSGDEHRR